MVEKQINVLNESFINFFKQGVSWSHGIGFLGSNNSFASKICNSINYVVLYVQKPKKKKPKCGFLHKTKSYGIKCGYCKKMGS